MSATPLVWKARLTDLVTGNVIETVTKPELFNPAFGSSIDTFGKVHVELRPGNAFINAIIDAWGGSTYDGDRLAYLLELSQDDGGRWDTACWLKAGDVVLGGENAGVIIDQNDIAEGYANSYIDYASYIAITLDQTMGAGRGAIEVQSNHIIAASPFLETYWHGLFDHTPGRFGQNLLKFTVRTEPKIANIVIDTVVNSDSILDAATNALNSVAGVFDPSAPLDYGSFQHYIFDVPNRLVRVGYRGQTTAFSVTNQKKPSECDETVEAAIIDSDQIRIKVDLSTWFAQTQVVAGASNHGMPDGGQFTGVVIVNKPTLPSSTEVYDNLIVLSITTNGNGLGGVFTWLGDGYLRPISQAVDVNDLTTDDAASMMIAATRTGVYQQFMGGPYTRIKWQRVGTLNYEFTKVWVPATGIIYAIAGGSNNDTGINGLWRWTATTDWIRVSGVPNLIDASGTDSALYFVNSVSPTIITQTSYPTSGTPTKIDGTGGAHIVGLDYNAVSSDVIVRTETGAQGLYRLHDGVMTKADPLNSLVDGFGPLAVQQFVSYIGSINGQAVNAFCITDRGIWWRATTGGSFFPTDGLSGIQDVQASWIAAGTAQTVMGRTFVPLVAVSGAKLYLSRDGGKHWFEAMSQNLDALVAWYEVFKDRTGEYPRGDFGAFATNVTTTGGLQDDTDPEGNGNILYLPYGDPLTLPSGWVVARRWTDNGTYTCRMVDTTSRAPYNAMKPVEAVDIQANDARGVVDASGAALTYMYRVLSQLTKPQAVVPVTIVANTQESAARLSTCGDRVALTLIVRYIGSDQVTETYLANYISKEMFIIDKQGRETEEGSWVWDLTLVNETTYTLLDLGKILAALATGQAKDRRLARKGSR